MNATAEWVKMNEAWISRTIRARITVFFLIAFAVLCGASAAHASDIYVAQSAAGAGNGSSCAAARAIGSLGSGDWSPGNTIHLCGSISSTLNQQGNGSSGNPITIKFEPGAGFSAPYIDTFGALQLANGSWYVVDGGGGNCGYVNNANVTCNGSASNIQSTNNCSSCSNHQSSIGIWVTGSSNVTIKGIQCGPLYQHTDPNDNQVNRPECIQGYNNTTNLTIQNSTLHDASWMIDVGSGSTGNVNIFNNEIYNMDHGVAFGNGVNGGNIHDNHFHDMANWDDNSNSYHHDAIHLFGNSSNLDQNINEYNNLFDGTQGNHMTAEIYNEMYTQNLNMYNNVAIVTGSYNSCCGVFDFFGNGPGTGYSNFYNNTIYQTSLTSSGSCFQANNQANVTMKNNIFINCNNIIGVSGNASFTADYNAYATTCTGNTCNSFSFNNDANFPAFSQWQSDCGCDQHGQFISGASLFNVSGTTGRLGSGSPLIGTGTNLTSVGLTTLDAAIDGTPRPSGTTGWDFGAFESGGAAQTQPAPPTNLKAVAQ